MVSPLPDWNQIQQNQRQQLRWNVVACRMFAVKARQHSLASLTSNRGRVTGLPAIPIWYDDRLLPGLSSSAVYFTLVRRAK
ncbi:hypothetical protein [Planctomicrobium sp. SH527]|uniref:hypothetical protein n=1 Tax=Planctomicrobium sp. SH527 TaxID=3448123 RepID=UPI003F5C66DB